MGKVPKLLQTNIEITVPNPKLLFIQKPCSTETHDLNNINSFFRLLAIPNSKIPVSYSVSHLFRILPKARVVYCSATGVTDVKNMVSVSLFYNLKFVKKWLQFNSYMIACHQFEDSIEQNILPAMGLCSFFAPKYS